MIIGGWSPEREQMIRAEYADAIDTLALIERANQLPGDIPLTAESIRSWARRRGLKKNPAIMARLRSEAQRAARRHVGTPAHIAVMPALWADRTLSLPMVVQALNEADPTAAPIKDRGTIVELARRLGLQVPRFNGGRHQRKPRVYVPRPPAMRKARALKVREPVPEPEAVAPPAEDLTPEQQAELVDQRLAARHDKAREMLARRIDPDKVRAQTGLPLREVFRLVGEARMGASP